MLHPVFSAAIQRPDLVVGHLSGYVALIGDEAKNASAQLMTKLISAFLAVLGAAVFLTTTGVAVMLGFSQGQFHWAFVAVPAFALVLTLVALFQAMKPAGTDAFVELKLQLDKDRQMLSTPG